tara:strand:+ start:968 stop:2485 length:1518 start_codon:yes stop_codon:yes gene_type:complete
MPKIPLYEQQANIGVFKGQTINPKPSIELAGIEAAADSAFMTDVLGLGEQAAKQFAKTKQAKTDTQYESSVKLLQNELDAELSVSDDVENFYTNTAKPRIDKWYDSFEGTIKPINKNRYKQLWESERIDIDNGFRTKSIEAQYKKDRSELHAGYEEQRQDTLKGIYNRNIYASAQEAYNGITDIMSEENFITPVDSAKQKAEFGQSELYNITKIRLSMLDEQLFNEEITKNEYRERLDEVSNEIADDKSLTTARRSDLFRIAREKGASFARREVGEYQRIFGNIQEDILQGVISASDLTAIRELNPEVADKLDVDFTKLLKSRSESDKDAKRAMDILNKFSNQEITYVEAIDKINDKPSNFQKVGVYLIHNLASDLVEDEDSFYAYDVFFGGKKTIKKLNSKNNEFKDYLNTVAFFAKQQKRDSDTYVENKLKQYVKWSKKRKVPYSEFKKEVGFQGDAKDLVRFSAPPQVNIMQPQVINPTQEDIDNLKSGETIIINGQLLRKK